MTLLELPRRERDVALLIHEGAGAKEIAARLGLGYGTARQYIRLLYLHVSDWVE